MSTWKPKQGDHFTSRGYVTNDEQVYTSWFHIPSTSNIVTPARASFVSESLGELIQVLDPVDIPVDSTFRTTDLYDEEGRRFFDHLSILDILPHPTDLLVSVLSGEENRLDLFAFRVYQNDNLWPIIAIANDIYDPFYLKPRTILRVPSLSRIYSEILP